MKLRILLSILRYLYLWIIIFLFIIEFPLMIGLTTRRLAIIVAIIYIIKNHKRFREIKKIFDHKKITYFFLSLIAVFCISIFHYLMRGENIDIAVTYSDPWYFLYIVLYVLVFSIYCAIK